MKLLLFRTFGLLILLSLIHVDGKKNKGQGSDNRQGKRNGRGPVHAQRCRKNKNKMKCAFPTSELGLEDRNVDQIELDLKGDGKTVVCERQDYSANGLSWHGKCGQESGDANFVRRKARNGQERIFGSVHMGDEICNFGANADGVEEVECQPQSSYMDELPPHKSKKNDGNNRHLLRVEGGNVTSVVEGLPYGMTSKATRTRRRLFDDSGTTLDIMVVWTKEAECLYSGLQEVCTTTESTEDNMLGLIDLAIEESNTAFTLSGINTQLRLVHAYQHPDYVEKDVNTFNIAVDELQAKSDGELDDVHEKRALYGADLVALIVGGGAYCGIAYLGPNVDSMFSVTHYSCATGYYSFVHEIAHNIGSLHDRGTSGACAAQGYNYGWRDPSASFRTIMAYQCVTGQCDNMPSNSGCNRIQRFSTPDFEFAGRALGDAENDNARHINERLATVAGYFPAMNCEEDMDCDDRKDGTIDTCNIETRVCVFAPTPTLTGSPTVPSPSAKPSGQPSVLPTVKPSSTLSKSPSDSPSSAPSTKPSPSPSSAPSATPTNSPSTLPSALPTSIPSTLPSSHPSETPSSNPSRHPSVNPTPTPSGFPSASPSFSPSVAPQTSPTTYTPVAIRAGDSPTAGPTLEFAQEPSNHPSGVPSNTPTSVPSSRPSGLPSSLPSVDPTRKPSPVPSHTPSHGPTSIPSNQPSFKPSAAPSAIPSAFPTALPTSIPTDVPSSSPSMFPTLSPSSKPSASPATETPSPTESPSSKPIQTPRLEFMVAAGVSSESWKIVSLQNHYMEPIPVCAVDYGAKRGMIPAVVRLRNVRASSFEVKLQNPSGKQVQASDVHCIVVEKGAWFLPDGRMIEAQSYTSTRTDGKNSMRGERQSYQHRFRQNPVVLGQVLSYNDSRFSVFWSSGMRAHHMANRRFLVTGKHVSKDKDRNRANEVVGFIVIEPKHAVSNDVEIESFSGPRRALSYTKPMRRRSYFFRRRFTASTPRVIVVSQAAQSGKDASWAVLDGAFSAKGFNVAIDEDEISGSRRHMWMEPIDGIAFSTVGSIDLVSKPLRKKKIPPQPSKQTSDKGVRKRRGPGPRNLSV